MKQDMNSTPKGTKLIPIALLPEGGKLPAQEYALYPVTPAIKRLISEHLIDGHADCCFDSLPDRCKEDILSLTSGMQKPQFIPLGIIKIIPSWIREQIDLTPLLQYYDCPSLLEVGHQYPQELPVDATPKPIEPKPVIEHPGIFMKTLAIRQPWASLIALGIKDIECREAMHTKCRKIFIAASLTKVDWWDLEDEVRDLLDELYTKGILPAYDELPTKCIIGHADIVKADCDPVDSYWGRDWDGMKYTLRNAEVLDEPLYGFNKATPYFYNVEGYDEEHLPASHKVDLTGINLPK